MRPLQILNNRYIAQRQTLEFQIEAEINAPYPCIDHLDQLFDEMARLNIKEGYLNQLIIDIQNARNGNRINNEPAE